MDERKALKAALLLSRVICAHMEDAEFSGQDCDVSDDGQIITYEDLRLNLLDCLGGAMMLLRGIMLDVAELEDVHPVEIARLVEITTAMNDAVGTVEASEFPPYMWN